MKYEVRQIESLYDGDGWTWNNSYLLTTFQTKAKDEKRAFTRALKNYGIAFKKNRTRIEYDGDIYEIINRKTKEPLFAAIPMN